MKRLLPKFYLLILSLALCSSETQAQLVFDRVTDFPAGKNSYQNSMMTILGDSFYYVGRNADGNEVLKANAGSASSESEISLTFNDTAYSVQQINQYGGKLYLVLLAHGSRSLWIYQPISGIFKIIGRQLSYPLFLQEVSGKNQIAFTCRNGNDHDLFIYHTTHDWTEKILSIPSSWEVNLTKGNMAITSRYIYFTSYFPDFGYEVRCRDRQLHQTYLLKDIHPSKSNNQLKPKEMYVYRDKLYFTAHDGTSYSIWSSDGTPTGTLNIGNFVDGAIIANPINLYGYKNWLLFSQLANKNGISIGYEYHYYDIESHQGGILMDIVDAQNGGGIFGGNYTVLPDSSLAFTVEMGSDSIWLWKSDGTLAGTKPWFNTSWLDLNPFYIQLVPARKGYLIGDYSHYTWVDIDKHISFPFRTNHKSQILFINDALVFKDDIYVNADTGSNTNYIFRIIPASIDAEKTKYLCKGGDVFRIETDIPTSEMKHVWNNSSTQNYLDISDTGWYWVDFKHISSDSLIVRDSLRVDYDPFLDFNLGSDIGVSFPYTIAINKPGSYLWSDGSTENTFKAEIPGTYWIEYTSPNACIVRDSIILSYPLGLLDLHTGIHLYPNPSQGTIHISFDQNPGSVILTLFDMQGNMINSLNSEGSHILWSIDTKPGIYWIQLETELGIQQKKLSLIP